MYTTHIPHAAHTCRALADTDLKKLRIVVDERERKSGIPDLLDAVGMNMEVRTLPVGDYIVRPETAVERKSIRDLLSSIFDGRLFDQCQRLREHYQHPVIVMEGNVDEIDEIAENPMVLYGALSSVALEYRIPVIPTPSAMHTAKLLISLCFKKDHMSGPLLKKIKKHTDPRRQQLSVLASLPGVGDKLAVRMLERFGTPADALAASSSDIAKIPGMGASRAQKIRSMLDTASSDRRGSSQTTLED